MLMETVNPVIKVNSSVKANNLDDITNKVFKGILQEKSEGEAIKAPKSDKGSVKVNQHSAYLY